MPPYFSGFVRPSSPSSPSRLNTWCAGNSSAASHASTCGLTSSSMKRFSVRWISWCSWVINMVSLRSLSRPRDAELHRAKRPSRCLVTDGEGEGEDAAGVARVDDAVVEHQPRGVERARLALEVRDDLRFQRAEPRL